MKNTNKKNRNLLLALILAIGLLSSNLYSQITTTYTFTGGMQTFTVPAGVSSVFIQNWGAQGGAGQAGGGGAQGGGGALGGYAEGFLAVTPGQVLNIFVGGQGATPAAGFNGGGTGGSQNAGGGGGASDVRVGGTLPGNRVITAGGGGGGGRGGCHESGSMGGNGGNGGFGGGGVGTKGDDTPTSGGVAGGGFPGNQSTIQGALGPKGIGCSGFSGLDGFATSTEVGGDGGGGQSCCCFSGGNSIVGGGGGGGGQVGGGGGGGGSAGTSGCSGNSKGAGGGGGGGSSFIGGVTSGVTSNGIWLGNGQISITYTSNPVVLTCPINTTVAACQSQAAINTAFSAWLATASGSGGCNGVLTNNNTGAPSACGGSTTVTFTYNSTCDPLTTTCQATFTVAASPTVVLTCPINTTAAACQSQAAINTAFSTWLATASASGGCNGVLTNNNSGAPSACGGSTTVTFTYNSTCAPLTTTCQATFTVAASPTVVLTCPINTTAAACQSQAAINTAFSTWLATASASGGCNGVLTNNNTGAPSACGGSTTVTFTYNSTCAPLTTTCQATYTVLAAPTVVLTCPANLTTPACQSQTTVNTAFANWLALATGSGGCNATLTNNNIGAPLACGGSRTVTFTRTSTCAPLTTTCQATFTVPPATPPSISCPAPVNVACASSVPVVNTGSVIVGATCIGTATVSHVSDVMSNSTCANKFTLTRTYRAIDGCGNSSTCAQIITVNDNTPPTLNGVPPNVTIECDQAIPGLPTVSGTDNCTAPVVVSFKETSTKSNFPNQCSAFSYKITRTWTGTDNCNNSTSRSQVITVRDTKPPVWKSTPPAFITVQCDEDDQNNVDPVAMDGCDGNPSVLLKIEYLPIPKSCSKNYRVRSTWTAGDKCGNIIKFVQVITVLDTEAPVIVCPKDIEIVSTVPVPVSWAIPKANDFCEGSIIPVQIAGPPSGSTFQPGTKTVITYKATDACGNMKTCSFTVNIKTSPGKIGFINNSLVDNEELQATNDNSVTENGITLYQNEPNPFSSNTFIRFDLDKTQNAMLCIFDVNGRMVKCYENTYNKGENKVEVTQGDLPVAGVYFYQLKTAEHNSTKRMIMIR